MKETELNIVDPRIYGLTPSGVDALRTTFLNFLGADLGAEIFWSSEVQLMRGKPATADWRHEFAGMVDVYGSDLFETQDGYVPARSVLVARQILESKLALTLNRGGFSPELYREVMSSGEAENLRVIDLSRFRIDPVFTVIYQMTQFANDPRSDSNAIDQLKTICDGLSLEGLIDVLSQYADGMQLDLLETYKGEQWFASLTNLVNL